MVLVQTYRDTVFDSHTHILKLKHTDPHSLTQAHTHTHTHKHTHTHTHTDIHTHKHPPVQ